MATPTTGPIPPLPPIDAPADLLAEARTGERNIDAGAA